MGEELVLGACEQEAGERNTAAVLGTGGRVVEPLMGRMSYKRNKQKKHTKFECNNAS